jgi:hypothetical protein
MARHAKPRPNPGVRSERIPLSAAPVRTVLPTSAAWAYSLTDLRLSGDAEAAFRGAYVWVQPPEGASDEKVAAVARLVRASGAAAVHVEPRRRSAVVTTPEKAAPPAAHKSVRETVAVLVSEANTNDREALRAVVESALGRAGA